MLLLKRKKVAHACGLGLKKRVQTHCSASGLIFVMQNCMHISQTCVKKTRFRIAWNATVLQFKWMDLHIQRRAHALGSFRCRLLPNNWVHSYRTAVVWSSLALPPFCAWLIRPGKTNYSQDAYCHLALWLTSVQNQTMVAAITGLWHNT